MESTDSMFLLERTVLSAAGRASEAESTTATSVSFSAGAVSAKEKFAPIAKWSLGQQSLGRRCPCGISKSFNSANDFGT